MRRHWYQRVILLAAAALGGVLLGGSFLDAVGNARTVHPLTTYIGSALLALGGTAAHFWLRRFPLRWVSRGKEVRIRGLGTRALAAIAGAASLLWIPRLIGTGPEESTSDLRISHPWTHQSAIWIDPVENKLGWRPVIEVGNFSNRPMHISGITLIPEGSSMIGGKKAQFGFVEREYFFDVYNTLTALKRANRQEASLYTFWAGTAGLGRVDRAHDNLPSETSAAFPFMLKPGESRVFLLDETLRIVNSDGRPVSLPTEFRDRQILLFRMLTSDSTHLDKSGNFACTPARVAVQVDHGDSEHVADIFEVVLLPSDGCYISVPCPAPGKDLGKLLENWKRKPDGAAGSLSQLPIHKGRETPFTTLEIAEFGNRLGRENLPLFLQLFPENMSHLHELRGGMVFVCNNDARRNEPESPATLIRPRGKER